jgi:predicted thioesterase
MLKEGLSHDSYLIVSLSDTAKAQGSGDMEVLATPRLVALMENAAMLAAAPSLAEGETTVGSEITITHVAPSAVGAEVVATAVLDKIEGRKLSFTVSAKEGDKLIGEGRHIRYIVDRQRFMSKLNK